MEVLINVFMGMWATWTLTTYAGKSEAKEQSSQFERIQLNLFFSNDQSQIGPARKSADAPKDFKSV